MVAYVSGALVYDVRRLEDPFRSGICSGFIEGVFIVAALFVRANEPRHDWRLEEKYLMSLVIDCPRNLHRTGRNMSLKRMKVRKVPIC